MAGDDPNAASFGLYDAPQDAGLTGVELTAIGASVLWLLVVGGLFLLAPGVDVAAGQAAPIPRLLLIVLAVLVPLGLIWIAALTLRTTQSVRVQNQRLQAALDSMRRDQIVKAQSETVHEDPSVVLGKLDEIAAVTRRLEQALSDAGAETAAPEPAPQVVPEPVAQQAVLDFETDTPELPPLASEDFIRALNFPETAEDTAGFAALKRALRDRNSAQLIQASEDILTLLSQEGVYMDDLVPDRARPEIWRYFSQGLRGRPIAALGGVRDGAALALAAGRMKQDPIFRDAAHHFLRLFDKNFAAFETHASDAEIAALAETRTARAFMLLGRVAGTFD